MTKDANSASTKGPISLALLIIVVGIGWLLGAMGVGPGINWIWTLGLGFAGICTFILSGGVDKSSIVIGPFFLAASMLSVLRQSGRLPFNLELPVLVILVGVLLLVAQMKFVPSPKWYHPPGGASGDE